MTKRKRDLVSNSNAIDHYAGNIRNNEGGEIVCYYVLQLEYVRVTGCQIMNKLLNGDLLSL